jgi:two-component system CheB/CheR fusion protein
MGASAGGLEALEQFFTHMPSNGGIAFVLVLHLDAHHKSAMSELLRRYTKMPVLEIADRMEVQADRVHVIPPNATMTIERGVLRLVTPRAEGMVIDAFFRSLAEDQQDNAVGVVLSGSGSDGTLGLKAIKEQGGLTLAQAGESSRYDSMPRSAQAAGVVDFVLPVQDMPARLIEHVEQLQSQRREDRGDGVRREARRHLAKIFALLRTRTGHDFSHYKDSTLIRRVQRRMQVVQVESFGAYVAMLRKSAREVEALFRDLLIGVTHFFRDPKSFEALGREVIAKILEDKGADDPVRVWVPGCATGEEAYSIAILLREQMMQHDLSGRVQIFATDIDDRALAIGRNGIYRDAIARDVSPERLERFFVRDGDTYRIVKDIREMCIFSIHNLIKDAPFSKLDLVSCRNLLIYLDASLQSRVLQLFHFALRQRGFLFLGPSENVSQQPKLWSRVNARLRLFKARPVETGRLKLDLPVATAIHRDAFEPGKRAPAQADKDTMSRRAQRIVESYAPASVVIDETFEILHFSGRSGRILQPSPGTASLNLFNIVEPALRPDLRTLIHQAMSGGRRASREGLSIAVDGGVQAINVVAEPLPAADSEPRLCVLIFQEVGAPKAAPAATPDARSDPRRDETIRHLESELVSTRERLQTTIEELETSNEEMKSSNEEFQSVNEELQSSNEELETSKEELQSVNEELETVNAELISKVETLDRAISDRKNLLESTQIATLFLDNDLRVKSFTPAMTEIFRLIEADLGRPITDIVTRIDYEHLPRDVNRVLRTLTRIEQEVALADGSAGYIMRILPYRTVDNVIDGVVVTFVDITERKKNEEAVARLAAIVASSQEAIIGMSSDGVITTWNGGAERTYGYSAAEAIGRPLALIMSKDSGDDMRQMIARARRSTTGAVVEIERLTKDGRKIFVLSSISPIRSPNGRMIGVAAIERDITERKIAERQQKVLLAELNHRVKNTLATVLSIFSRTRQSAESLESFAKSFEGRIRALARAHDLLSRNMWSGVDLRQMLQQELAPYAEAGDGEIALAGRPIFVSARAGLALGMIVHELATNAAKYGALSNSSGKVALGWKVGPRGGGPALSLTWTERGGPPVKKPRNSGFGLRFMQRSLEYEFDGALDLRFAPRGLRAILHIPMDELQPGAGKDGARRRPRR